MSKLVKTMLTSLAVLIIIAIAAFVVILNINEQNKNVEEFTIDDIVEYSYQSPEITTDLEDGNFVRIQFQIITDSKEAKEEISKRDFQLKNILIKELSTLDKEAFKSGLSELEKNLQVKLNGLMTEGNIIDVYTTDKVLQ